ncbi:MAG: alpha-L-rhamnosidase [Kiritimatiellia bacterium]|jgi:alpha-L-rhamnosidase
MDPVFHEAKWIWSGAEDGYNDFRQARHAFALTAAQAAAAARDGARLRITADALYQARLNGHRLGFGPAKSAQGTRGVDPYEVSGLLAEGGNVLEVVVLNIGVGTMTYCPGKPGLRFEIRIGDETVAASGTETQMRIDRRRRSDTVRRWILPCIEDFNAAGVEAEWEAAVVVERNLALYPRRVPLPTREALPPKRLLVADRVRLPSFAISFRHKPYLVTPDEWSRANIYETPAWFVTDIVSPVAQTLRFTPTCGSATWYREGRKVFAGSGWEPWTRNAENPGEIALAAGANRLIGVHHRDHFEQLNLAGFCEAPVRFANPFGDGGFQVVLTDAKTPPLEPDWEALRVSMPTMDPAHTMEWANGQDLVVGAEALPGDGREFAALLRTPASAPLELPPAAPGTAVRLILDLGAVHNGWLAFTARGREGSRLIFSFFEGFQEGLSWRPQWTFGSENALTYRLADGVRSFESFHPYGVRYIAIHHTGEHSVSLSDLRVLTANCGSRNQGCLRCSDPLLNDVYEIGVQSVISGMDDTFIDCPTFEQVNWNCDNRAAFLGESLTCGNREVARHSIELFAEDPGFTGLVRSQYPSTWDAFIPVYSFHWILWCRDYADATGDLDFIRRLFPRIRAGVEEALGKINAQGLFEWSDVWHFVEWGHGRDDEHAVCSAEQAGLAGALEAAGDLAERLGEPDGAAWRASRDRLVEAINRELWDESRQAYVDSLHEDGKPSEVASQTVNAMMGIYGVASEARARALADRILAGDKALLPYGSPFGLYYILELYDRLGWVEPIFAAIRHRWGDMVRDGDRTTWEHFAEFGYGEFPTRSRCHPFAAYVVKYLAKYLLGVRPPPGGTGDWRIEPNPPADVTFCRGAVPTSDGIVRVDWERA